MEDPLVKHLLSYSVSRAELGDIEQSRNLAEVIAKDLEKGCLEEPLKSYLLRVLLRFSEGKDGNKAFAPGSGGFSIYEYDRVLVLRNKIWGAMSALKRERPEISKDKAAVVVAHAMGIGKTTILRRYAEAVADRRKNQSPGEIEVATIEDGRRMYESGSWPKGTAFTSIACYFEYNKNK